MVLGLRPLPWGLATSGDLSCCLVQGKGSLGQSAAALQPVMGDLVSSAAALGAALPRGLRNRKWGGGFSQYGGGAELFAPPCWTQVLPLLASCLQARVLAPHAAVGACCSGGKGSRGWGWRVRGAGRTTVMLLPLQGYRGVRGRGAVTLQLGLELGKGDQVSFTCSYLFMSINQRSGRQTPKG